MNPIYIHRIYSEIIIYVYLSYSSMFITYTCVGNTTYIQLFIQISCYSNLILHINVSRPVLFTHHIVIYYSNIILEQYDITYMYPNLCCVLTHSIISIPIHIILQQYDIKYVLYLLMNIYKGYLYLCDINIEYILIIYYSNIFSVVTHCKIISHLYN